MFVLDKTSDLWLIQINLQKGITLLISGGRLGFLVSLQGNITFVLRLSGEFLLQITGDCKIRMTELIAWMIVGLRQEYEVTKYYSYIRGQN